MEAILCGHPVATEYADRHESHVGRRWKGAGHDLMFCPECGTVQVIRVTVEEPDQPRTQLAGFLLFLLTLHSNKPMTHYEMADRLLVSDWYRAATGTEE